MSVKISELPILSPDDIAAGDVVAIVDQSAGVTKQVDLNNVLSSFQNEVLSSFQANRNAIINGNFGINQRNVSGTVTLSAGAYGHDRWKAGASGCTYTFNTSENVTTITISSGTLVQVIEGLNLFTGTYVLSWTGTAQGKIGAGSFGASGVTQSVTGGTNLAIEFNTGTVSLVQLEAGSVATPLERRPVGAELALCQRYFQSGLGLGTVLYSPISGGTFQRRITVFFPVQMRSTPAIGSVGVSNIPSPVISNITTTKVNVSGAAGADVECEIQAGFTADAEL